MSQHLSRCFYVACKKPQQYKLISTGYYKKYEYICLNPCAAELLTSIWHSLKLEMLMQLSMTKRSVFTRKQTYHKLIYFIDTSHCTLSQLQ